MAGAEKAVRILDAAEALLLRFGYRRVTIDEVARKAGVGKGTAYLFWSSKVELCGAVLARESAWLLDAELAAMRADPEEVLPHRAIRRSFLLTMQRPLTRAFATGDHEVLGELLTASHSGARFLAGKVETTERYLTVLAEHGLLADDPETDPSLFYRFSTAVTGAFLMDGMPGVSELELPQKADALATTVRRAFEPARGPAKRALRAAADELIECYERWAAELAAELPERTVENRAPEQEYAS